MSNKNVTDVQIPTTMREAHVSTQKRHDPAAGVNDDKGSPTSSPRMPHERDESFDSQASAPRDEIRQAYEDVMNGQLDTDLRGMSGVQEVFRDDPGATQNSLPESARQLPSTPEK